MKEYSSLCDKVCDIYESYIAFALYYLFILSINNSKFYCLLGSEAVLSCNSIIT